MSQNTFTGWNEIADEAKPSDAERVSDDEQQTEELPVDPLLPDEFASNEWSWQWLPKGLIYRSYMAGMHDPRMALVTFYETGNQTLWDATLGGRVGLLRFGDCDVLHPQGYQLDF